MDTHPKAQRLIRASFTPMLKAPDLQAEQVSQALLGETVIVEETAGEWCRITTPDGYSGWAAAAALVEPPEGWDGPWAEIRDLWANLRPAGSSLCTGLVQASIGTRLPLVGQTESWVELLLPDGQRLWTEATRVFSVGEGPCRPTTVAAICEGSHQFLGVPYLWGGRSFLGLDCSGFVQTVLRLHGVFILRDANQQAEQGEPVERPTAGDLAFFGPDANRDRITHVALMLDEDRFIHASGSACVRYNALSEDHYRERFRFCRRFLGGTLQSL